MLHKIFKDNTLVRLNEFFGSLALWSIKFRILVILALLAVTAFSLYQLRDITIDNTLESYFLEGDESIRTYENFKAEFGSDLFVYIVYTGDNLFTAQSIKTLKNLSRELQEKVPYVKKDGITTVANVEYMETVKDELRIYDLMEDTPDNDRSILLAKEKILKKPMYRDNYVSKDGSICALLIELESSKDRHYDRKIYTKIYEVLEKPEYKNFKFRVSGKTIFGHEYTKITRSEFKRLFSLSLLILTFLLFYIFRRFRLVLSVLIIVVTSIIWSLGLMVLLGWPMRIVTTIVPPLLMACCIGDSVHIIAEFRERMHMTQKHHSISASKEILSSHKDSLEKAEIIFILKKTVSRVGVPCLLTSLTTAIGFISLCVAPIKPIRETGILSAFGVIVAFILTVLFLPTFLSFEKMKYADDEEEGEKVRRRHIFEKALDKFLDVCISVSLKRNKAVIAFTILLVVLAVAGISRLKVETNFIEYFSEDMRIKKDYNYIDTHMGGSSSLQVVIDSREENGIKDPRVLKQIDKLQHYINSKPVVKKSISVIDILLDIKSSLDADNPDSLPASREEISQYLLLYEQGGGKELSNFVDYPYSKARINVRLKHQPAERFIEFINEIKSYVNSGIDKNLKVTFTGGTVLSAKMVYYMVHSQIYSLLLAFIVITCCMAFVFASIRIGLISMIPNLLPVLLALGLMGWIGRPLDFTTMLIGCITIGIAVDDTIHFFNRNIVIFRRIKDTREAVIQSMKEVGGALFFTTVILTLSFLVVATSPMKDLSAFGYLSGFTITTALLADLMLGPTLLLLLRPLERRAGKTLKNISEEN